MIMGGQLDGLLSHWQPAFANKLMMMMMFVSLSARLRENGWTDLHEIFREGVG